MCGILHLRLAALFISPVLVTMIRTFEIVMGLVLEVVCLPPGDGQPHDYASTAFAFKVGGCALVTLSAVLMAASDRISGCEGSFLSCGCRGKRQGSVEPETKTPLRQGPNMSLRGYMRLCQIEHSSMQDPSK